MSDSNISSSSSDSASVATVDQNGGRSQSITDGGQTFSPELRHWRDVFWLAIFIIHLIGLGFVLAVLGLNRFKKSDRLNIDRYTNRVWENNNGLTENYWPKYAVAGGAGAVLGWTWLLLLGSRANQMMKVSVHILTTYLAVISVLCFWCEQFFWGVAFAIGAALQFLYVISVIDRLPFTMLVLQKAVKMVLSVSLFWTGAVLCNTVHVIVSGLVFLVLIHGGRNASSMPPNSLMKSFRYAVTTSFGSICYGSLFTAAIRTLRWEGTPKSFERYDQSSDEVFQL
ncbi:Choline transporter-like protein [Corchorus olitorius]|uniref:Choline transporter-like protein n=1 Tax=Corchorus olitorius TaxID=93759 RepID=A0A1R3KIG4_9ROSI|nr:Choline transporter-like protein [Corchorus olitorius]